MQMRVALIGQYLAVGVGRIYWMEVLQSEETINFDWQCSHPIPTVAFSLAGEFEASKYHGSVCFYGNDCCFFLCQ